MRILLVEDEPDLAGFVRDDLEADGYTVDLTDDGDQAVRRACGDDVDLVVLDLGLPGCDGLDVLQRVRARRPEVPVIIVSARGDVDARVRGLDLGADDYLAKPFALSELGARIRSALRRPDQRRASVLEVAGIEVDLRRHEVRRAPAPDAEAREIELTAREYQLLVHLMRHPDQVLSRQQLLQAVWDLPYDPGTKVVEVYIGQLRRKLGADGADLIRTVRQAGYRLCDR